MFTKELDSFLAVLSMEFTSGYEKRMRIPVSRISLGRNEEEGEEFERMIRFESFVGKKLDLSIINIDKSVIERCICQRNSRKLKLYGFN